jgi:hypothetical protein
MVVVLEESPILSSNSPSAIARPAVAGALHNIALVSLPVSIVRGQLFLGENIANCYYGYGVGHADIG